ncbi:virulence RhuM family protein [Clostridium tagluense]|uniref:virulence RhuM family protein n=1 Tax=Clostridium tagluense TaxID=360422 RepID=UPI001CF2DF7D|nr:virulence RhuM family protein [Clostridium tagluense]MCB2313691.1 virulence RhuM family protein [Clostridium tagluense]MCB2318541.1 virulence RhuM family protein [Clostridium tagluense]MCB2323353.1 virulence RhuM family protein [Clostridium tagluense]MCB2328354.1 virulence RhuM family protein [Clostridium tagluense]MCB2333184.1 virulence RhuM family protein [Clostridium tagluense]
MAIIENKIVLYSSDDGKRSVNVLFIDETFWATQRTIAELFNTSTDNIGLHLKNIFEEEELDRDSTTVKISVVQKEGNRNVKREVVHYNLDAIIAVGYRVNSKEATRFRKWSTQTLKDYIVKGFVINDDLMKNGRVFGKDYFDELLEKIREIRASERRAYQKIADIFEQCSYDYNNSSSATKTFYAFVQNKLHYAITGKTAAELITERVNCELPTMGLTNWKNSPDGKILKRDIVIVKNYLNEKELSKMNRIVTMFIDYAEMQSEDEIVMSMQDWVDETNRFLENNRRKILHGSGQISHENAAKKATSEYEKFRVKQDERYISNFDLEMEKYLKGEK